MLEVHDLSPRRVTRLNVDRYATRFGIREVRMRPERGLLLNGRRIVAKGGNLHHDLGCLGSAVLKAECERRRRQWRHRQR